MQNKDARGQEVLLPWRVWVGALLLAFAAWLLIRYAALLAEAFVLLFGAFLITLAMRPAVDYLGRWRVPRWVTVLLIYLVILTLLGLIGGWMGTAVNRQVAELRTSAPGLVREAVATVENLVENVPWLGDLFPSLDTVGQTLTRAVQQAAGTVVGAATGAGRVILELLIVVALSFIFTVDKDVGTNMLENWVPARYRPRISAVVLNASERLQRWVIAQLAIIVYFAVTYGVGLMIIGVPFALLIAIIGGLLELVPFIGGVVALVLSVVAALTVNPILVLWVLLLYIVVTQVEANIVQPQLYGAAVDVHPALVLVALFVGGASGGILGALFAVPVVVVITAVLREFMRVEGELPPPEDEVPPPAAEAAG